MVLQQHLLQRLPAGQVQVIVGFVEQQQLRRRLRVQFGRQRHLHALAAAEQVAGQGGARAGDAQQRTPLHVATYARQREAIRLLAAAGADLNAFDYQRYDPVTIAAVANDEETLARLLQLGASARNVTSPYDGTALIAAAHLGHVGVVRQLIAAGAPLDHINNLHWTALIEAVVLGDGGRNHTEIVRLLLAAGANSVLGDRDGNTPLKLAQARGYKEMEGLLMANQH